MGVISLFHCKIFQRQRRASILIEMKINNNKKRRLISLRSYEIFMHLCFGQNLEFALFGTSSREEKVHLSG
jgi:hypothetical protein